MGIFFAPFVEQLSSGVIDDEIVGGFIREQNNITTRITDDAVTVFHGSFLVEHPPAWNYAIAKIPVSENLRSGLDCPRCGDGGKAGTAEG